MNRALALLAVSLAAAAPAEATVVCFHNQNLAIPASTEGLYINFLTGAHAETEGGVPGFDFDPYAAASTTPSGQLRFYWGQPAVGNAGVASSGDTYAVLQPGAVVSSDSLFTRAGISGNVSAWTAGVTGYLGMRFRNEDSGAINYGYVRLTTTAPLGFPTTVHGWCFENSLDFIVITEADPIFADGFDG